MKLIVIFMFLLFGGCSKDNQNMPVSLAGKTLRGTITSGSDSFASLEGYQFSTVFVSQNQFESKNAQGILESAGQYNLKKNHLILQSNSGLHNQETLEVILKFTDSKSGAYEAHYLSGPPGEQTGIFTLQ